MSDNYEVTKIIKLLDAIDTRLLDISNALVKIADALANANTKVVVEDFLKPAGPPPKNETADVSPPPSERKAPPSKITKEQVIGKFQQVFQTVGETTAINLNKKYGIERLSHLPEDKYYEYYTDCVRILESI